MFGGGAGGGKSLLGCYWIIKNCFKYPGSRWLIGRSKLKTLKETTLVTFFDVLNKQEIPLELYNYNTIASHINFYNGSQVLLKDLFLYPSDPDYDELGSLEITGAFIDECSQVTLKAKNIVKSRIRYKLDDYGVIPKLLMTTNPSKGWPYNEFYKANTENKIPEHRKFVQALHYENPFLSPHYSVNLDSLDKVSRARLKLGDWDYDSDPSMLINYNSIVDTFSNTFVTSGKKYITADIARFGDDKTVIGKWDGMRCEEIKVLKTSSIPDSVNAINVIRDKYQIPLSQIIVDEQGVGGGVKDVLRCMGFIANQHPFPMSGNKNYNNLKSQCFFKLAEMINTNKVYINCDTLIQDTITEELEVVKSETLDKDSKMAVISKDKMKETLGRSPDFADMLMMRMYFEFTTKYFNYDLNIELT
jgi:hypothetical protein